MEDMEEIRYLINEEKEKTRPLWEEIFPEDGKEFLNYYYSVKTADNEILALEKDGRLCSMLQLNPYRLQLGDVQADSAYVIAVATRRECRHQGMMRKLLVKAMCDRYDRHQPFLFLMPADEAIYRPFGFRFGYEQLRMELPGPQFPGVSAVGKGSYAAAPVRIGEEGLAAAFANQILKEHADVFALRDADYYRILRSECASEEGDLIWISENGRRIGLTAYTLQETAEVREPLIVREYRDRTGEILNACFGAFARPVHVYGLLPGEDPEKLPTASKPVIMLRPLYLPSFLSVVRADEELEFILRTEDAVLPENRGVFTWKLGPEESSLEPKKSGIEQKPEDLKLPVEALVRLLFGNEDVDTICREEHGVMTPEARKKWKKVRTGLKVFLNEIV